MMRRRCTSTGVLLSLVGLTLIGYGVLMVIHRPVLSDFELVDIVMPRRHLQSADAPPPPPPTTYPPITLDNVDAKSMCGGQFVGYANQFARLQSVTVDRRFCVSARRGGEAITDVINQAEQVEYYQAKPGCFQLTCRTNDTLVKYAFQNNNHLNDWMSSLRVVKTTDVGSQPPQGSDGNFSSTPLVKKQFTIAIQRYEYANIYHTMTDWYNAYLVMRFFNQTRETTDILYVDSHPFGVLDSTWDRLFHSTSRLSDLPADRPTLFRDLVWGWMGYNSPVTITLSAPHPKYMEDFRKYFLASFDIRPRDEVPEADGNGNRKSQPDCANLTTTFIWRHDYVAHPRNPSGLVTRKIANEEKLLNSVRSSFPRMRVRGVQIDKFSMKEQLELIDETDILIGMHGAGLTHTLFLPSWAALVELVPSYWSHGEHFQAMAAWRQLDYHSWVNVDLMNELADGRTTIIPHSVAVALVSKAVRRMCPNNGPSVAVEPGSSFSAAANNSRYSVRAAVTS